MITIKLRVNYRYNERVTKVTYEIFDILYGDRVRRTSSPMTFGRHLLKINSFKWYDQESAEVYQSLKS